MVRMPGTNPSKAGESTAAPAQSEGATAHAVAAAAGVSRIMVSRAFNPNASIRPDKREQASILARWNHYLAGDGSTLRASYRFYRDNFGVTAHTLEGEWAKPVSATLTLTPGGRGAQPT